MSTSPRLRVQAPTQLPTQGPSGECFPPPSVSNPVVTPSKRSDDDIQFISCKPVKRRKLSEQSEPVPQQQSLLAMPATPPPPVAILPPEPRDPDRRVSTGMVGLPSDFNAMELTFALRGVSLPVLEKFVLDQPSRKPRPPSPPELSPKQLPQTVAAPFLNISANENDLSFSRSQAAPMACMTSSEFLAGSKPPPPRSLTLSPDSASDRLHVVDTPGAQVSSYSATSVRSPKESDPKSSAMLPPPLPGINVPAATKSARNSTISNTQHGTRPNITKQPCQVCVKMRQQASFAKTQGIPLMHHNMPHHMVPQMACHQPYGQHIHPHMMAMGQNNVQAFGSSFAPFMIPFNGSPFTALSPHLPNPVPIDQQGDGIDSQPSPDASTDPRQPTQGAGLGKSSIASNPIKPPASLIQPTYRKPSPNLIVDVAETCQEKFPFEEVARRHDVPIEKVFDVFAAIIQVPLLRCPTDRRRAGKLATSRVKEYTRTKKAIQQTGQANSNPGEEIAVGPSDIANRLGEVDFPDGFDPQGP
ncbi:hypothetical protein F4818DRAFT_415701 [Hypoxylon cercidicola]|nr:hypothetical protein F4818DRAFT_415701 [Hypoxylon cercidicola]